MKTFYKKKMDVSKPKSLVCDKCEVEYFYDTHDDQQLEIQEFLHIDFRGGYSSVFYDGSKVTGDFCQNCVKELLGKYLTIIEEDF